jgi:diguanylate cyclase (GGDEF)-like protein/PAS domain S-box-containing protein
MSPPAPSAPLGILTLASDQTINSANPAFCQLCGYTAGELAGRRLDTLLSAGQAETVPQRLQQLSQPGAEGFAAEFHFEGRQGESLRCWVSAVPAAAGGATLHVTAPAWLPVAKLEPLLHSSCAGVVVTDCALNIVAVNHGFSRVTGYREAEVVGQTPHILKSGRHGDDFYRHMWRSIKRHGCWHGEVWNRHRDGRIYAERLLISTIADERQQVQHYLGLFYDISAEVSRRDNLDLLAHSDTLTGLPNRRWFNRHLELALARQPVLRDGLAVLFVDLDGFKAINDNHGHHVGDAVLRHIAQRLASCVREHDDVARWGGDELVVALHGVGAHEQVEAIAAKILDTLAQPLRVDGSLFHVTVSIGIALHPNHGSSAEALIERADQAMYAAKHAGRNQYAIAPDATANVSL